MSEGGNFIDGVAETVGGLLSAGGGAIESTLNSAVDLAAKVSEVPVSIASIPTNFISSIFSSIFG